ncbi:hypothetical protein L227DRAFT_425914 [Lentinus tigrinus ALCF2SS1-6]|uniref:Uncharacterized protein n=1 Tax=Lentinus tigrinus ALCF2SS1-6 TaxID=1328759 RepID=A0A5C2RNP6_9APHY|nr:hypothetical protein L227DRAFT_425914 [Lentinus tigrinus ALCF2SS1-6]
MPNAVRRSLEAAQSAVCWKKWGLRIEVLGTIFLEVLILGLFTTFLNKFLFFRTPGLRASRPRGRDTLQTADPSSFSLLHRQSSRSSTGLRLQSSYIIAKKICRQTVYGQSSLDAGGCGARTARCRNLEVISVIRLW